MHDGPGSVCADPVVDHDRSPRKVLLSNLIRALGRGLT
ncbi:hypothetical protein BTZ20_0381 [Rhodococcus sp. MTM3W5.2]|nr:hypothetical protein BTZ20_0381 [Rhodococcus sp. MTM3W5.2]